MKWRLKSRLFDHFLCAFSEDAKNEGSLSLGSIKESTQVGARSFSRNKALLRVREVEKVDVEFLQEEVVAQKRWG